MSDTQTQTVAVPEFEFRHRLGRALEHGRVSVAAMAEYLEVSTNTVGNYTSGRTRPPASAVKQWALRCGVPYAWLKTGEDVGPIGGPPAGAEWVTRDSNPEPTG